MSHWEQTETEYVREKFVLQIVFWHALAVFR